MPEFLMKPRNYYAFKELMSVENVRIGFLSAILKLDPCDIKESRILKTDVDIDKIHPEDKLGIIDIGLFLNDGFEIDVDFHISEVNDWAENSLFYFMKMYSEQMGPENDYGAQKRCININIFDFDLFNGKTQFHSIFNFREKHTHKLFSDKMEFHIIELPKLPAELKDNDDILLWAKFINIEKTEDFDILAGKNEYIDNAYEYLKVMSQDAQKRMEYEARENAIHDHSQTI